MFRSSAISTLLILLIFIANEVLSASKENLISQKSINGEFIETREAELLEERSKRLLRNERFDVSKEDELLHRRSSRIPIGSLASSNDDASSRMKKSIKLEKKIDDSKSNGETSEIKDMNESHVTPHDDDDDPKDGPKSLTTVTEHPLNLNDTKNSLPPKVFPDDDRVQSISDASPALVDKLTKTSYSIDGTNITKVAGKTNEFTPDTVDVVPIQSSSTPPTVAKVMEISTSMTSMMFSPSTVAATTEIPADSIPTTNPAPMAATDSTKTTIAEPETEIEAKISTTPTAKPPTVSTEATEVVNDVTKITGKISTISTPSPAEMLLHSKKIPEPASMPRGVVALITAISFTIVAVTIYIGLIVRRRFIEWRHGNRELLVNEFDATDISNFEL